MLLTLRAADDDSCDVLKARNLSLCNADRTMLSRLPAENVYTIASLPPFCRRQNSIDITN